jgi:hypothetical protein
MNPTDFDIEAGRAEWSSFMLALLAVLAETTGPVLAVGVGFYSTRVLHEFCEQNKRPLLSLEEDSEWAAPFLRLASESHAITCGPYDATLADAAKRQWSVILLDHSPGPRRGADMALLLDHAEFIVVHDYHLAIKYALAPYMADLHQHVIQSKPPTLVVSRNRPMPQSVLCL